MLYWDLRHWGVTVVVQAAAAAAGDAARFELRLATSSSSSAITMSKMVDLLEPSWPNLVVGWIRSTCWAISSGTP